MPLPNVLLIGDSIRMSYLETVRTGLSDVASVVSPGDNGGTTRNVLKQLDTWMGDVSFKLAHVNAGLHDLAIDPQANGRPRVELPEYEANVRQIITRLRSTGALVMWALTTPVIGEWHKAKKGFERWEKDVDAYNAAARRACTDLDVPMTDLFSVVMQAGPQKLLLPDGVHFNPEGVRLLGQTVTTAIRAKL
jgi:lysophospholipase L1-like esterase